MSDAFWIAMFPVIATMFSTAVIAWMQSRTGTALKENTKVTDDTHTLVNSNMEKQLLVAAVALRRIAELTKHPADEAAANLAEEAHQAHQKKQKAVDVGAGVV